MREAIGATWIFGIVIVFIVLFTGYLAFSVNYAKAFTIKDKIVDIIEKYNGPGKKNSSSFTGPVLNEINAEMKSIRYSSKGSCYKVGLAIYEDDVNTLQRRSRSIMGVTNATAEVYANSAISFKDSKNYNYCVIRQQQQTHDEKTIGFSNYFIATFFSMNIEIINLHMNFFVTGQTKNISYPVDGFLTFEE